ncbi:MobC family plasmid mobilization relaxosome protein [Quadrisphaera sp. INWT6]|uniref:MobC family plasmid mobilization relaxosome protein n=1 Tax=Quadrisphaera sp. INWT6 TaxID=2596917 RepID=UPI0018923697|nr:MobC family plasmid mobilization relaxosome protein [Quadrisphaera sp. INWT6]MBF5083748.1 MobC family plasmid mobilization relaxosome protein [Quadrisphaera sp. INWT6]
MSEPPPPDGRGEVPHVEGLSAAPQRARRNATRRQPNQAGGRTRSHRVKVTDAEAEQLTQLATAQGVSVPRLMVESALSPTGTTPAARQEAIAELFAVRRLLAAVSNNVNQIARHANATSEFPGDAVAALGAVHRTVLRIDETIDDLALTRPRVTSRTPAVDLNDLADDDGDDWAGGDHP